LSPLEMFVLHIVLYAFIVTGCYTGNRMGHNSDQSNADRPTVRHVTVAEAARLLNLSPEDVGSQVQRGTLDSIRVEDTVYVLWDADQARSYDDHTNGEARLLRYLRDQVAHLRQQLDQERDANRENRRIIAALTQSAPEPPPLDEPGTPGKWSEIEVLVIRHEHEDQEPSSERPS
jgi:hypothetical protein